MARLLLALDRGMHLDLDARQREAGDVRVRVVELFLCLLEGLPGPARTSSRAWLPVTLTATMPEPASAVSNVIGTSSPAFGDRGPATTIIAFAPRWRAAMAL